MPRMVAPLYGAPASDQKSALAAEINVNSAAAANTVFKTALDIFRPPIVFEFFTQSNFLIAGLTCAHPSFPSSKYSNDRVTWWRGCEARKYQSSSQLGRRRKYSPNSVATNRRRVRAAGHCPSWENRYPWPPIPAQYISSMSK